MTNTAQQRHRAFSSRLSPTCAADSISKRQTPIRPTKAMRPGVEMQPQPGSCQNLGSPGAMWQQYLPARCQHAAQRGGDEPWRSAWATAPAACSATGPRPASHRRHAACSQAQGHVTAGSSNTICQTKATASTAVPQSKGQPLMMREPRAGFGEKINPPGLNSERSAGMVHVILAPRPRKSPSSFFFRRTARSVSRRLLGRIRLEVAKRSPAPGMAAGKQCGQVIASSNRNNCQIDAGFPGLACVFPAAPRDFHIDQAARQPASREYRPHDDGFLLRPKNTNPASRRASRVRIGACAVGGRALRRSGDSSAIAVLGGRSFPSTSARQARGGRGSCPRSGFPASPAHELLVRTTRRADATAVAIGPARTRGVGRQHLRPSGTACVVVQAEFELGGRGDDDGPLVAARRASGIELERTIAGCARPFPAHIT
ncbi:hypothetical protein FQR65_LT20044 [Abscondita terminalis]|nr:hypothetical protein FQR65_LT20044 [Abscondita terminalis]